MAHTTAEDWGPDDEMSPGDSDRDLAADWRFIGSQAIKFLFYLAVFIAVVAAAYVLLDALVL